MNMFEAVVLASVLNYSSNFNLCKAGNYQERVICYQKEQKRALEKAKRDEEWWESYYKKHGIYKNFEQVPYQKKKKSRRRRKKRR